MKLSTRARYALRMMLDIQRFSKGGRPVSLEDVAARTGISRRYLDQIVLPLRNASLVRGVKGPGGGYVLGRPGNKIPLGEIVECEIGPITLVDCVGDPSVCDLVDECTCNVVYKLLSRRIRSVLNEITLADLTDRGRIVAMLADLEGASQARTSPSASPGNESSTSSPRPA